MVTIETLHDFVVFAKGTRDIQWMVTNEQHRELTNYRIYPATRRGFVPLE